MPVSMSKIASTVLTTSMDWGEDQVEFGYRPAAITPNTIEALDEAKTMGPLVDLIVATVDWWDVLDESGNRLPVTPEIAREYPMGFLSRILRAAMKDSTPSPEA